MDVALRPFGDTAWRARLPEPSDAGSRRLLFEALRALPDVVDVVVSEQHALVVLARGAPRDEARDGIARVLSRMRATGAEGAARAALREHVVRVRYDGEDLAEVASASGLSPAEVVAVHAGATYEVASIGFCPGFAYLRGLDPRLVLPRRATPRPRIPPLSVAIAGPYTGVYPSASPGGWHLLGTALGFAPFDPRTGALLSLGDRVRFVTTPGEAGP
ncbi:MAG TPA: carboxyltransferase domain-containing protein [Polyangiaceae bacterium]